GQLSFLRVAATSFGLIFLTEWGDITQVATANLAARYSDPLAVGVGAALGLSAVAAFAVNLGAKSHKLIPMAWVQRITGTILLGFGLSSVAKAIRSGGPVRGRRQTKGRRLTMPTAETKAPPRGGPAPPVAVIGTGIMGSAMARNLIAAGVPTTVWDRS